MTRLPHTPRIKLALDNASREAHSKHCESIGTEHLLLAMLGDEGSIAYQVLATLGVTKEKVSSELEKLGVKAKRE